MAPGHRLHQLRVLQVLGVEAEVRAVLDEVDPYHARGVGLGCGSLSDAQTREVQPILAKAFLTDTAEEWVERLAAARVPVSIVRTTEEWLRCAHVRDSGLIDDDGHLSNIAWLTQVGVMRPSAGMPKNHSLPVMSHDSQHDGGGCTSSTAVGVRVLDCTNVIAGPTISHCLARMGCDVIKIDPVSPLYSPEIMIFYGLSQSRQTFGSGEPVAPTREGLSAEAGRDGGRPRTECHPLQRGTSGGGVYLARMELEPHICPFRRVGRSARRLWFDGVADRVR